MLNSLIVACALIGMPTMVLADADADTTEVVDSTTEVVEETSSEEDVFEIVDEVTDEDFNFESWFSETFTWQTISAILSYVVSIGVILKSYNSFKEKITGQAKTLKQIDDDVTSTAYTAVQKSISDCITPLLEKQIKLQEKVILSNQLSAKLIAASQDSTATGKAYTAELVQQIGEVFNDSATFAKEISADIKKTIEAAEKVKTEITEKLSDIVDETSGDEDGTQI